jgi:hypothetical protein
MIAFGYFRATGRHLERIGTASGSERDAGSAKFG